MSEVKKISPVGNIYGWEESEFGEFVRSEDYAALEAEAKALREEVAAYEDGMRSLACQLGAGGFNSENLTAAQLLDKVQWGINNLIETQGRSLTEVRAERDALRARVVVVPERDGRRMDTEYPQGWNDCLDELARLNGKAVSEGLLRESAELLEGYAEVIRGCKADEIERFDYLPSVEGAAEELRALLGEGKEHE